MRANFRPSRHSPAMILFVAVLSFLTITTGTLTASAVGDVTLDRVTSRTVP